MIILHEDTINEAELVAKDVEKHWGIKSRLINENCDKLFRRIPHFSGDSYLVNKSSLESLRSDLDKKAFMVITPRDLYNSDKSQNDDWVLGSQWGCASVVSLARMKTENGVPSNIFKINSEKYNKRVSLLCLHEIGHDLVSWENAPHLTCAYWVNASTGYKQVLGSHCLDNKCLMYEVVDIKTPSPEQGWLFFENPWDEGKGIGIKRFDAGIDDNANRLYPNLFCEKCAASVKIPESYSEK